MRRKNCEKQKLPQKRCGQKEGQEEISLADTTRKLQWVGKEFLKVKTNCYPAKALKLNL